MNSTWGRLLFRSLGEMSRFSSRSSAAPTSGLGILGFRTSTNPDVNQCQCHTQTRTRLFPIQGQNHNDRGGGGGGGGGGTGGSGSKWSDKNLALSMGGFSLGFMGYFEKKQELSPEDNLLIEIKRAILAIREGELQKAERHLATGWKMSDAMDREDVKTQIMDIQANVAFQKGELDKAIRLFQLVTQRLVYHQGYEITDNAVIEISIKLAQMFTLKGQDAEALAGFQYCADTQIEKIEKQGMVDEDTLMLAAWSLQSLSQAYMASGTVKDSHDKEAIKKAKDFAQKAYKYSIQAVGPDSQQAIAISTDLATLLAMEGQVEEAIKRLEECEKAAADKYYYMHAPLRVNTGSLYLQKGDYTEAERICREAKVIAGKYRDTESLMRAEECIVKSDMMSQKNQNANKINKSQDPRK